MCSPLFTTDLVAEEFKRPEAVVQFIELVKIDSLNADELDELEIIHSEHMSISRADISALLLARKHSSTLVTDDGQARRLAMKSNLVIHGSLWVLDQIEQHGLVCAKELSNCLTRMIKAGGRFPLSEVEKRLAKWLG
ncbi:MAG: hypothetical protein HRF49_08025 [bacterium]